MFVKATSGLVILLGVGTLCVTHFMVGEKVKTLNGDLADMTSQKDTAVAGQQKAETEAKDFKVQLDATTRMFVEATNVLSQVSARLAQQESRANRLATDLENTTIERNDTQRELAAWKALGLGVEDIRGRMVELQNVTAESNAQKEEIVTLVRRNTALDNELRKWTGGEELPPSLPAGTKGKVVAVDPKYDFVILDIGGNQQLVENARMLVNRDGKLIGKIRITRVEPTRAIGNVMPEWRQDEIMEGDQVLY